MPRRRQLLPLLYGPRLDGRSVLTKVDLRSLAFFSVMLILIGLAGWLYLRQASEVAAYAHEIRELERDKERLLREITSLRADVAITARLRRGGKTRLSFARGLGHGSSPYSGVPAATAGPCYESSARRERAPGRLRAK